MIKKRRADMRENERREGSEGGRKGVWECGRKGEKVNK